MAALSDALVQELLHSRRVGCLATVNSDQSLHLTAVWYLFDEGALYVATAMRTRKARNLQARPTASLMVDSRDPQASCGATLAGQVELLRGAAAQGWNGRIHRRYLSQAAQRDPHVGPVFEQFDDVTICLRPTSVFTWDMRALDQAVLGGAIASHPDYLLPLDR